MNGPDGFTNVPATVEEIVAYKEKHSGWYPSVNRVVCNRCGKRMWGSGLGIGSHRRSCVSAEDIEVGHFPGAGPHEQYQLRGAQTGQHYGSGRTRAEAIERHVRNYPQNVNRIRVEEGYEDH